MKISEMKNEISNLAKMKGGQLRPQGATKITAKVYSFPDLWIIRYQNKKRKKERKKEKKRKMMYLTHSFKFNPIYLFIYLLCCVLS